MVKSLVLRSIKHFFTLRHPVEPIFETHWDVLEGQWGMVALHVDINRVVVFLIDIKNISRFASMVMLIPFCSKYCRSSSFNLPWCGEADCQAIIPVQPNPALWKNLSQL